jgi:hypothetical protein
MPVKYWSFAGLMLTEWCNAQCACCYLGCGPGKAEWMTIDDALRLWGELIDASPHGCRAHLTGGEPFGRWELLLEIARCAHAAGLGPLDKVETNGYWATSESVIRERIGALDDAGMQTLGISADPYHQRYVPIDRVRTLARIAREMLGPDRVQVRWNDWLTDGCDTSGMDDAQRTEMLARYLKAGRDRLNGRAAKVLAPLGELKPIETFADQDCRRGLLRGRHVHVFPDGAIMPGVCAGILLGRATLEGSISQAWEELDATFADRPIVGTLASGGPVALMRIAQEHGFVPESAYASKCHLCWTIREFLFSRALFLEELGPSSVY